MSSAARNSKLQRYLIFTGYPNCSQVTRATRPIHFQRTIRTPNSPQAWSASTVFSMVQAMLGLYPYAPLKILMIDPHLPDWLPDLTVRNLRVGNAVVTIRFFRKASGASGTNGASGTTDYEVQDLKGTLHVLRQPSPWSLTAGFAERVRDALLSLVH